MKCNCQVYRHVSCGVVGGGTGAGGTAAVSLDAAITDQRRKYIQLLTDSSETALQTCVSLCLPVFLSLSVSFSYSYLELFLKLWGAKQLVLAKLCERK